MNKPLNVRRLMGLIFLSFGFFALSLAACPLPSLAAALGLLGLFFFGLSIAYVVAP